MSTDSVITQKPTATAAHVPECVLTRLHLAATHQPQKIAYTFYDEKCASIRSITFKQLEEASTVLAWKLLKPKYGLTHGDCVLLVYPPSLDFIVAFLACLRAKLIACPVAPPDPTQPKLNLRSFGSIQQSSASRVALTNSSYTWAKRFGGVKQLFSRGGEQWPEMKWINTDKHDVVTEKDLIRARAELSELPSLSDLAFLQYTSGSTSEPKGVMVSHGNLAHNLQHIAATTFFNAESRLMWWVPHFHDLGLILCYLEVIYMGASGACASPLTFIRDPVTWLRLCTEHRATHTVAPNFAFPLTVRKWNATAEAQRPHIDLSAMEQVGVGAEPVDPRGIAEFVRLFTPFGFKAAVHGAYGLAEHTVCISGGPLQALTVNRKMLETERRVEVVTDQSDAVSAETSLLASCGFPAATTGVDVRIVNPESCEEVAAGCVGELWVSSPSVAQGYYKQPEASAVFHATIHGSSTKEYLRTGDLAFVHNSALYICGRIKDLIIVHGRNVYPQDVEITIRECDDRVRPGGIAAFAVPGDKESAAAIVEVKTEKMSQADALQLAERVRVAVATTHQVTLSSIVVCSRGVVQKTTSGKVQRSANRQLLLSGDLVTDKRVIYIHRPTAMQSPQGVHAAVTAVSQPTVTSVPQPVPQILVRAASAPVVDAKCPSVVVIGAGPSGLIAAHRLQALGHKVTVLESQSHVAGKCSSVTIDDRVFDLGGHLCQDTFTEIRALMQEFGMQEEPCTPPIMFNLTNGQTEQIALQDVSAEIRRLSSLLSNAMPALADPFIGAALRAAPQLALPAAQWLQQNGFSQQVIALIAMLYTSSGYGYLEQVPMLYVAKFIQMVQMLGLPRQWTIAGGYGSMWEKVAASLSDVRCSEQVTNIHRSQHVQVRLSGGKTLVADHLVMATSSPAVPLKLLDASATERSVLNQVETLQYWTTIARCVNMPTELGFYLLKEECLTATSAGIGRCVSFHRRYSDSDIMLFYSYGETAAEVETAIERVLAAMGARMTEVLQNHKWDYFAHFGSAALGNGVLNQLEMMQGENHTVHLSSMNSFELVECNIKFASAAVQQHFAPTAAPKHLSCLQLVQLVCAQIGKQPALPHPDKFFAHLNFDAQQLIELCTILSERLDFEVSEQMVSRFGSVRLLAHTLQQIVDKRSREGLQKPILADATTNTSPRSHTSTSAVDKVTLRIQQLVAAAMRNETLPEIDAAFVEMGLDSLQLVQLVQDISTAMKVTLDNDMLFECTTPRLLAQYVSKLMTTASIPVDGAAAPAEDQVTLRIRQLCAAAMNSGDAMPEEDSAFVEMGLDSLQLVQLVQDVSTAMSVTLDNDMLFECSTPRLLARYVCQVASSTAATAFVSAPAQRPTASPVPMQDTATSTMETDQDVPYQVERNVVFHKTATKQHTLDVYLPNDSGSSNGAAFVFVASAGFQAGEYLVPIYESGGVYDELCKLGFVVFNVRLGLDEHETELPALVEQVKEAVRWAKRNSGTYGVNPTRIVLGGISAGAHLALCSQLTNKAEDVHGRAAALALFCPVMSLPGLSALVQWDKLLTVRGQEQQNMLDDYSPIGMPLPRKVAPMRIYHSQHDDIIALSEVKSFAKRIQDSGTFCEVQKRDSEGHVWLDIRRDFRRAGKWIHAILPFVN